MLILVCLICTKAKRETAACHFYSFAFFTVSSCKLIASGVRVASVVSSNFWQEYESRAFPFHVEWTVSFQGQRVGEMMEKWGQREQQIDFDEGKNLCVVQNSEGCGSERWQTTNLQRGFKKKKEERSAARVFIQICIHSFPVILYHYRNAHLEDKTRLSRFTLPVVKSHAHTSPSVSSQLLAKSGSACKHLFMQLQVPIHPSP